MWTNPPTNTEKNITTYFRHTFNITEADDYEALKVNLLRDDGAVVYLNGTELFRSHMPTGTISHTTFASTPAIGSPNEDDYHPYLITGDDLDNLVDGDNVLAVEVHQVSATSSDVSFDLQLIGFLEVGSTWKYLDNGTNQGTAWYGTSFNDSAWDEGPSQLGYGDDNDEVTVVSYGGDKDHKYITTYFRHSFNYDVSGLKPVRQVVLELLRDDGAAVYLNGEEIFSPNLDCLRDYTTVSPKTISGAAEDAFNVFFVDPSRLMDGSNVLAVEIHQRADDSSDISFDMKLTAITSEITYSLSSNTLEVYGTPLDDEIEISSDTDTPPKVTINGEAINVEAEDVDELKVWGYDGDDTIDLDDVDTVHDFDSVLDDDVTIYGGRGDDSIVGSDFDDEIYGNAGADTIYGDAGADTIYGEAGADLIYGDDDTGSATEGADSLYGGADDDTIHGEGGADTIYGDDNDPYGGAGDDYLYGGTGNDSLVGEGGNDTYVFSGTDDLGTDDIVEAANLDTDVLDFTDFGQGVSLLHLEETSDQTVAAGKLVLDLSSASGIENVKGTAYDDGNVMGNARDNVIWTYAGNDDAYGGDGADCLYGGAGNDSLQGGTGNDTIYGDGGDDTIQGESGDDVIYGDDDTGTATEGDDSLYGNAGDDTIYGEGGDDLIYGDNASGPSASGADCLYGNDGNDTVYGQGGDDWVYLYDGAADTADGGDGTDTVSYDSSLDSVSNFETLYGS